jgi:1,4-alpha-glucan branching enzyme
MWREVLNTDAAEFGGSGAGNYGVVAAHPEVEGGAPIAKLTVPGLSTLWLRYQPEPHVPTAAKG